MNIFSYFAIFRPKELSPNHVGIYSVNSHGYVDLSGQIVVICKSIRRFIKCDFSNASFKTSNIVYWIKNKTFVDSTFSKTTFNALAEHGNQQFC